MKTAPELTVAQVAGELGLKPLAEATGDRLVTGAIVSDLLSYVMAKAAAGQVWVTVQGHANVVAVAALAGLAAVVIAAGFEPEDETRDRALEEGIPLFVSEESAFALAGKLYALGLR
ncbi:MAG: serine kinase [Armatimonadota bacterium]